MTHTPTSLNRYPEASAETIKSYVACFNPQRFFCIRPKVEAASATDFRVHRPLYVIRFRDVRFGHVMTPAGAKEYLLCGEFLPAQREGKAAWTLFATIKTSSYEQWQGVQAFKLRACANVHKSYGITTGICRRRCRSGSIRCDRDLIPASDC
jgi:hypothetical protein